MECLGICFLTEVGQETKVLENKFGRLKLLCNFVINNQNITTMNKARRKELERACQLLNDAKDIIEEVRDEEQECFDNMPEGIQYSERGDQMQENIDTLDSVSSDLDDTIGYVNDVIEA